MLPLALVVATQFGDEAPAESYRVDLEEPRVALGLCPLFGYRLDS
jgi:hypothetical protein